MREKAEVQYVQSFPYTTSYSLLKCELPGLSNGVARLTDEEGDVQSVPFVLSGDNPHDQAIFQIKKPGKYVFQILQNGKEEYRSTSVYKLLGDESPDFD